MTSMDPEVINVSESPVDVVAAEPIGGSLMRLEFSDGYVKLADLSSLMVGPVFDEIRERGWETSVVVDRELGTIVWPNGADLPPSVLRSANLGSSGASEWLVGVLKESKPRYQNELTRSTDLKVTFAALAKVSRGPAPSAIVYRVLGSDSKPSSKRHRRSSRLKVQLSITGSPKSTDAGSRTTRTLAQKQHLDTLR